MLNSIEILNKKFKKFIDRKEIESIVDDLAKKINSDFSGEKLFFLIVLKGSIFFAVDLLRKITLDCEVETIRAKSYGNSMTGATLKLNIENIDIKGKHVIIIEDIIDSGKTLNELIKTLRLQHPDSLHVAALLSKPEKMVQGFDIKYLGREISSKFVIGYGMDFAEKGRQYPDIYILDDD